MPQQARQGINRKRIQSRQGTQRSGCSAAGPPKGRTALAETRIGSCQGSRVGSLAEPNDWQTPGAGEQRAEPKPMERRARWYAALRATERRGAEPPHAPSQRRKRAEASAAPSKDQGHSRPGQTVAKSQRRRPGCLQVGAGGQDQQDPQRSQNLPADGDDGRENKKGCGARGASETNSPPGRRNGTGAAPRQSKQAKGRSCEHHEKQRSVGTAPEKTDHPSEERQGKTRP